MRGEGLVRVAVIAEPPLLREVLRAHVELDEDFVVVEDIDQAGVLVVSTSRGPLFVTGLTATTAVAHPTGLSAAIRSRAGEPRTLSLPADPVTS